MSWDALFDEPVRLPSGQILHTLRDAGDYISTLPKSVHSESKWQTAISVLLATAEGGPTMFARIGLMQAIMPKVEPVYDPKRNHVWRKASRR